MQQKATLPRSFRESRFPFPHLLSYKVYWGSDVSTMQNPNEYDPESHKSCQVTFDAADLRLSSAQEQTLLRIAAGSRGGGAGSNNFGKNVIGTVVNLEADAFEDRNHNAALLGDMVQALVREAKAGEEDVGSSAQNASCGAPDVGVTSAEESGELAPENTGAPPRKQDAQAAGSR